MTALGVHSETGKLRRVIVCAPGLAHERLTPANVVGVGVLDELLGWLEEMPAQELARFLIGGIAVHDLYFAPQG